MSSLSLLLVALPFALLGCTAPFGTTILGVVAIGQIKRSRGRLSHAAGSVRRAAVSAVAAGRDNSVRRCRSDDDGIRSAWWSTRTAGELVEVLPAALTLGIGLPIIAWVDYWIARAVWRNVTGYQPPPKPARAIPSAPAAPTHDSARPEHFNW